MKQPTMVRVSSLAKTLDTIQNVMELLGGEQKKGALMALNAVRKEYRIGLDGEQIELFDGKAKGEKK